MHVIYYIIKVDSRYVPTPIFLGSKGNKMRLVQVDQAFRYSANRYFTEALKLYLPLTIAVYEHTAIVRQGFSEPYHNKKSGLPDRISGFFQ